MPKTVAAQRLFFYLYHQQWYTEKIWGQNPNFLVKIVVGFCPKSNIEMEVIIIEILTKLENGDYMEIVNWDKRDIYWGWASVYDCPLVAYRGTSCLSPTEIRDEWNKIASDHYIGTKWKNGDTIIYSPDWTVKEWIKGFAHNDN